MSDVRSSPGLTQGPFLLCEFDSSLPYYLLLPPVTSTVPYVWDALNKCLIVDEEFRLTEYDFPEVKVMVV